VDARRLEGLVRGALGDAAAPSSVRAPPGKGCGFADFDSRAAAQAAMDALSAANLSADGRALSVDWASAGSQGQQRYPDDARRHCWFCLASPDCETHLVAAVGERCYTCMPKGPLVDQHCLVVPVAHASSRADMDAAAREELDATSDSLAAAFRARGLHAVAFERVADTKKGVYHVHRDLVPLPRRGDGDAGKLAADFCDAARRCHAELRQAPPAEAFAPGAATRSFVVDVYCGDTGAKTRLVLVQPRDDPARFLPLHFGRDVLANALGTPHKAHWKACEKSRAEEGELCEALKAVIAPPGAGGGGGEP